MLNPIRLLSRAAGTCALALALWSPAQATPVLQLTAANSATGVDVTVSARDVVDLYAFQFTLAFDPTLLTALSGREGSFLASGGSTFFSAGDIDNTGGTIASVFDTLVGPIGGVDGSGALATFSFGIARGGSAAFSLQDVLVLDSSGSEIPVDVGTLVTAVPEPAEAWLVATGLLALLARRRTSRKSS